MTFISGLVSEPPAEKYIYHPGRGRTAIVQGRHVLDKYNCAGCHVLGHGAVEVRVRSEQFEAPPDDDRFPVPRADGDGGRDQGVAGKPDRRGMLHADIHGLTTRSEDDWRAESGGSGRRGARAGRHGVAAIL